jgi:hypothetical protein
VLLPNDGERAGLQILEMSSEMMRMITLGNFIFFLFLEDFEADILIKSEAQAEGTQSALHPGLSSTLE